MTETDEPLGRRPTAENVDPGNRVSEAWAVLVAAMDKWRLPRESQLKTVPQGSPFYQTD